MTEEINLAELEGLASKLRITVGNPKPTVSVIYDASDAITSLIARLRSAEARVMDLETALEWIIDLEGSKKGAPSASSKVARAALNPEGK